MLSIPSIGGLTRVSLMWSFVSSCHLNNVLESVASAEKPHQNGYFCDIDLILHGEVDVGRCLDDISRPF